MPLSKDTFNDVTDTEFIEAVVTDMFERTDTPVCKDFNEVLTLFSCV